MSSAPPKPVGVKACLRVAPEGLTLYSNRTGLKSLAAWLEWLAENDPSEHFECHYRMTFENEATLLGGEGPSSIALVVENSLREHLIVSGPNEFGFELTFMHVTEDEIEKVVANPVMPT